MADERVYGKIEKLEEKLDGRLDKVESHLESLDKQMVIYNSELSRHIEGVQLAREENKLLKTYIEKETEQIELKIKPIQEHVIFVQNSLTLMMKIGGIVAGLIGIAIGLKQLGLF
jgi:dynactin complex subunit